MRREAEQGIVRVARECRKVLDERVDHRRPLHTLIDVVEEEDHDLDIDSDFEVNRDEAVDLEGRPSAPEDDAEVRVSLHCDEETVAGRPLPVGHEDRVRDARGPADRLALKHDVDEVAASVATLPGVVDVAEQASGAERVKDHHAVVQNLGRVVGVLVLLELSACHFLEDRVVRMRAEPSDRGVRERSGWRAREVGSKHLLDNVAHCSWRKILVNVLFV